MEVNQTSLITFLNKHNFTGIDQAATMKVNLVVEVLVYNLLNNVLYVLKALKVKVIQKKHFDGVVQIMKNSLGSVMVGGNNTLPAAYFDGSGDAGHYFDKVEYHNTSYVDDMTRAPLYMTGGSAASASTSSLISDALLKAIIEKYKREHTSYPFKISKDAEKIIIDSVLANLNKLFEACAQIGKKQKTLTVTLLYKTLKGKFPHMSFIYKK